MSGLSLLLPWLGATTVFVALAVGVVYALAVSRRNPRDWQTHVKEQSHAIVDAHPVSEDDAVCPRTVSLQGMLEARTEEGDAYFNPQRLPGYDRLSDATDRIEQRFKEK